MIFKINKKPWYNVLYNSLMCNKPDSIIDTRKGDLIEFEGKKYNVDGINSNLCRVSPIS